MEVQEESVYKGHTWKHYRMYYCFFKYLSPKVGFMHTNWPWRSREPLFAPSYAPRRSNVLFSHLHMHLEDPMSISFSKDESFFLHLYDIFLYFHTVRKKDDFIFKINFLIEHDLSSSFTLKLNPVPSSFSISFVAFNTVQLAHCLCWSFILHSKLK